MKTAKKPISRTAAELFYDSLLNNPAAIVAWCKNEIAAYEELIKIIEAEVKSSKGKKKK